MFIVIVVIVLTFETNTDQSINSSATRTARHPSNRVYTEETTRNFPAFQCTAASEKCKR